MGVRHRAREAAVQLLYQWGITGARPDKVLQGYWESRGPAAEDLQGFADELFQGVVEHAGEIDAMIADQTEHWRMDRVGAVEKSILRLGVYELVFDEETPPAVVIDEAVELAKRFSGPESGPFVNGVLDGIRRRVGAGSMSES